MTGPRLLAWLDREERRRRCARSGLRGLPPIALSGLAGLVFAAELARRARGGDGASELWLAVAIASIAVVMFGAPFRMYWRHDSAFLATLPIDGTALFHVAVVRSARAAGLVALPLAMGALAFGPVVAWDVAVRHVALLSVGIVGAAMFGSAAAVLAGTTVASDRAVQLIESVAGAEIGVPKTTWLGVLPGVAAAVVAAVLIAGAPWLAGASATAIGPAPIVLGASASAFFVALIAAAPLARKWMVAAVREVAALDRVRLAHVERVGPSVIERAWAAAVVPAAGRAVFAKDASLSRRRYPAPYFVSVVGVIALWIVAAARPDATLTWFGAVVGGLAAYTLIMARRLTVAPIEHWRLLSTLPVSARVAVAAKRRAVALRAVMTVAIGGVPVALRSGGDVVPMGIAVGVAVVGTVGIGAIVSAGR